MTYERRAKNSPLSLEVMWQARQMYEERDERGNRKHSMREVAAHFGISETSVLRAVTNTGRFANVLSEPLKEVKTEQQLNAEAQSSLERLQKLLAAENAEKRPGTNRADKLLGELTSGPAAVSQEVANRAREFIDPSVEIEDQPRRGENGRPVNPLDE